MSHRQPQKHVNMDHKSKYIPEHAKPVIGNQNSEMQESDRQDSKKSEGSVSASAEAADSEKSGYNFDWVLSQVNKYLESSKDFIKENSVETAAAAAATAGLAAWAALHNRSGKKATPKMGAKKSAKAKAGGASKKARAAHKPTAKKFAVRKAKKKARVRG